MRINALSLRPLRAWGMRLLTQSTLRCGDDLSMDTPYVCPLPPLGAAPSACDIYLGSGSHEMTTQRMFMLPNRMTGGMVSKHTSAAVQDGLTIPLEQTCVAYGRINALQNHQCVAEMGRYGCNVFITFYLPI